MRRGQRGKRLAAVFLCMVFFLFFWCAAHMPAMRLLTYSNTASLRYDAGGITIAQIKEIVNDAQKSSQAIPEITLWKKEDSVLVKDERALRSITLPAVWFYGNGEAAVPPLPILYGNTPAKGDKNGCILDAGTAYQLWGTKNAVGQSLQIKNKLFHVRGILDSENPMLFVQANEQEESVFPSAELIFSGLDDTGAAASEFIRNYQLSTPVILDGSLLPILVNLLIRIPAFVLFIAIAVRLLIRSQTLLKAPALCVFLWSIGIVFLIAMAASASLFTEFPLRFVPPGWSNFDFWQEQLAMLKAQWENLWRFSKGLMERQIYSDILFLFALVVGAVVSAFFLLERLSIRKKSTFLILCLLSGVILFAAFYFTHWPDMIVNGIFLVLPSYFLFDYILHRFNRWIIKPERRALIEGKSDEKENKENREIYEN